MKAINYLQSIQRMDAQIDNDLMELARLEALATKTTAMMGGEKVQSSTEASKMESAVIKIVEMKEKISEEIERYLAKKDEARRLISNYCDADSCKLIGKRYFQGQSWEMIAVEMGFTYKWVSGGLHQKAIAQVQKALDSKDKGENEDGERWTFTV